MTREEFNQINDRLWAEYTADKFEAYREAIIAHNMPLIKKVAKKHFRKVDPDDCLSAGYLGLIDAIKKFKPQPDTTFVDYAWVRIKGKISNAQAKDRMKRRKRKVGPKRSAWGESIPHVQWNVDCYEGSPESRGEIDIDQVPDRPHPEAPCPTITAAISGLDERPECPPQGRLIVEMRRDGKSFNRIADAVGISETLARRRYDKAITLLQERLRM